jgi:hypothetical protein
LRQLRPAPVLARLGMSASARIELRRLFRVGAVVVAALLVARDLTGGTSTTTSLVYDASFRAFAFARLCLVGIAAVIAVQRRITPRDGLLFSGLLGFSLEIFWQFIREGPAFWLAALGAQVSIGLGVTQFVRYAAAGHSNRSFVRVITAIAVVAGFGIACFGAATIIVGFGSWFDGRQVDPSTYDAIEPVLDRLRWLCMLCAVVTMEFAAVCTLQASAQPGSARSLPASARGRTRALWVVLGISPMVVAIAFHAIWRIVAARNGPWAIEVDAAGEVLSALVLTYGGLTRRLIDVEYAVIVASTSSVLLVGTAFGAFCADRLVGPIIERLIERSTSVGENVRPSVELIGGFISFLVISHFHEHINHFVRVILFKRRDDRLRGLEQFRTEQIWNLDPAEVTTALVEAVVKGTAARSVGIFRRQRDAYVVIRHAGPDVPRRIDAHSPLVPIASEPMPAEGRLVVPMTIGRRLVGLLLCGTRDAETQYAGDETKALRLLAREAANILFASPNETSSRERKVRKRRSRRR